MLSTQSTAQELLGKWVLAIDPGITSGSTMVVDYVHTADMYELSFFDDNTITYDNIISKEQGEIEINTQQWANGIYFFTITTKTEIIKGKFVINH